jgi:isochorismate synthase
LQRVEVGDDASELCSRLRSNIARLEIRLATAGAADGPRAVPVGENKAPTCQAVADRSHADYRAQVDAALRCIAEGVFEKVVLARSVCLRREGGFEPCTVLDTLRRIHPGCAIFAVGRGESLFFGATPECLVQLRDRRIETASVAGSAHRGRNPEEDLRLGRDLLESKKEQAEHAVVVRALRTVLTPHCEELDIPESPRLMQLQDIQHLETPIAGTARGDTSILDLLGTVHPTPAIAGEPREAALEWLADHENLDRGWYGGPVGFADTSGGGCFFAALRSSVVVGEEARLFAGAGIVEGSQPELELCETRLKLRTMLAPLFEI